MMDIFRIISTVFIIFTIFYNADAECGKKLFGVGCRFRCHCKNDIQCDEVTGQCSSGCDHNWAGPGCQYRNIAVDYVFTEHSDEKKTSSRLAIDGDVSTCTDVDIGRTKPWWRIWLSNNYTITELEIVINSSQMENFKEFKITVEHVPEYLATKTDFNDYIVPKQAICFQNNANIRNKVINIVCTNPVVGNQVRLRLGGRATKLSICDFRIFQGRNVAFNRRTDQDPSIEGGENSSVVVDGSPTNGKCSVTPWWSVDLAHIIVINRVNITTTNSNGFTILLSNNSRDWIPVYKDNNSVPAVAKTNISIDVTARFVKVENAIKPLTLCEVQILGDCLPNVCGFDCADPCHCKKFNSEVKMSGNCSDGCVDNWTGDKKKCDRVVPCDKPSGVIISEIALSLSMIGTVALTAVLSVLITIYVMKRRQSSTSNTNSSQRQAEVPRRPRPMASRIKERFLSIYYNTTLRPRSQNNDKEYDDLELPHRNRKKDQEGYTDLEEK
ncbi:uncharacterized protein LOC132735607 [Ruditapes philippinarum]|uniref:uncharacterized protein LOC132735607 n=1 Tax=Ruditapes philippinarum TaxID=129788 RepID=UPI00295B4C52|nr:uncharacterized protein LOC132735607 [Ruditapes philippinarum]